MPDAAVPALTTDLNLGLFTTVMPAGRLRPGLVTYVFALN